MTTHISTALISQLRKTAARMEVNAQADEYKALNRPEILLGQAARLRELADELDNKNVCAQTQEQS